MTNDAVTLEVGQKAPDFEAEITNGEKIKLSDVLSSGEKVILYFYPKDSTPGCTVQACDFRDNYSILQDAGFKVIGVSKEIVLLIFLIFFLEFKEETLSVQKKNNVSKKIQNY